jgi:DNA replication and repair protein RecF
VAGLSVASLSLSHVRSHARTKLVLDGRPVAIFGPNGAGKTNILEAVSLLSPGRGLRRAAAEEIVRRPDGPGWKIAATLSAPGRAHEVETWWEGGSGRSVAIDGKPAPQLALGRLVRVVWLVPAMDRLWIEGAEGRRRFLDRLALGFEPGHGEAVLAYDKAMRERNRLLRDQVRDDRWYQALESRMAEAGAAMTANRREALARITAAQAGAATAFPAAELALDTAEEAGDTAETMRATWAGGRRADLAAGRTLAGPHRTDLAARYAAKDMPVAAVSTGEQKALLVSLVLSAARALARDLGAPPLLLLDEVAAHLDAGRRAALHHEVCALGAQAWLTGTGPELFADLGPRAQMFEATESGGVSHVAERGRE